MGPIRLPASGRTYDASPSMALLEDQRPDGAVLFSGNVYRDPPNLLQRLGSSLALGRKAKTYEDKVREAVALASSQLGSLEDFIPDPATLEAAG